MAHKAIQLAGVSHSLVQDAMLVFAYARELVDEVIGGGNPDLTLTDAVRIARGAQSKKVFRAPFFSGDGQIVSSR